MSRTRPDSTSRTHSAPPILWTQKEAAAHLRVSPRYLRASSVPKILLPGNGATRKPLLRYHPLAVQAWWENNTVTKRYV
jgi:hypothetical protein